jgi:carbon monoxide dehydrogenase subunit G
MLQITRTIDIDAPIEDAWKVLAKLDDVQNFIDSISRSVYNTDQKEGVGASRTCDVDGFGTIVEEMVEWNDGESFSFTIEGGPTMMKSALSNWRLERKSEFQTTLHVTSTIEVRYGALGRLMEKFALGPKLGATLTSVVGQVKDHIERSQSPAPRNIEQPHAQVV